MNNPKGLPLPPKPEATAETSLQAADVSHFTYEDFTESSGPYEEVYTYRNDRFAQKRLLDRLSKHAKTVGFRGFIGVYREFEAARSRSATIFANNITEFQGQPFEMNAGEWQASDRGIIRHTKERGELLACVHPIMPVERLVNIDTGVEKLKLAYRKGGYSSRWRELIVEKSVLASTQKIIALADQGIAVNSETARHLVSYLHDIENLNYELIPERKSVSRLGFIEGEGFSPYVDGLIFDGDANFRAAFEAIKHNGKREHWMNEVLGLRGGSVMARIVLAASFASALVAPVGVLPFFVHLWGGESGTGKTVALMLAASVWANPEMGRYIQTFNSTANGREMLAGFFNHLPLLVDEMQLAKDAYGRTKFNVYELAQGVGKTRATRTLGVSRTITWANCIITTGESPLVVDGSGSGAVNRVIEIECLPGERIVEDGHATVAVLKRNYGFAGREFVERLYEDGPEQAAEIYKGFFYDLQDKRDTTEKQAMAAALILTADQIATDWIFRDGHALQAAELAQFLATRASVNAGDRAYRYMNDWVSVNVNRFKPEDATGDIYGLLEDGDVYQVAYIISNVFRAALEDAGYSPKAMLSHFKSKKYIICRDKNNTVGKRIKGVNTSCVALKLGLDEFVEVPGGWPEGEQFQQESFQRE